MIQLDPTMMKLLADLDADIEQHHEIRQKIDKIMDNKKFKDMQQKVLQLQAELHKEVEPLEHELVAIEERIKAAVADDLKDGVDHMKMEVKYRKAHQRTTWDAKALEEHAKSLEDPEELLQFKKTTKVSAKVTLTPRTINTIPVLEEYPMPEDPEDATPDFSQSELDMGCDVL